MTAKPPCGTPPPPRRPQRFSGREDVANKSRGGEGGSPTSGRLGWELGAK